VVALQLQVFHEHQRSSGTVHLGHGDRPVERHDRSRRERAELVVQLEDLAPVGVRRGRGVAVDGVDRGLDLIRARLAAA
jgi:hypothetical protein